jgi:hypothetical protein
VKSFLTTFSAMFEDHPSDNPTVERIEIPLIQRDYAQGRPGAAIADIRNTFLNVLCTALMGGQPVGLDFVYGEVAEGTLQPLDGQQRLTTLFLLHWYLASQATAESDGAWTNFSYATRPSARRFCQRLVANPLPRDITMPSAWIADQSWYSYLWRHDPTIQSMLVVIDAMHRRFAGADVEAAWRRLVDRDNPAIYFHLLPIDDIGPAEDLYIKMNSRGKPLTPFENFKARLERAIDASDRADEFAHKVDGSWSDLLWPIHGGDNIVDDEFMRFFEFVVEIREWRQRRQVTGRLERRAELLFGNGRPHAADNLAFLFHAFDTWVGTDIEQYFDSVFTSGPAGSGQVRLYGPGLKLNLFEDCCHRYGAMQGNRRTFALSETLLLYAILRHRAADTPNFLRRLRILRNLNEASVANELRVERMPDLVADVDRIIVDGSLEEVSSYNQNQVEDESLKEEFLAAHPALTGALFDLEDHSLLRGSLIVFELDPTALENRAAAFRTLMASHKHWQLLTGALLAVGDYSRPRYPGFWLGSPTHESWWREFLTTGSRAGMTQVRRILGELLDLVTSTELDTVDALTDIRARWLQQAEIDQHLDWRYYLVKYDIMRTGTSGIYATPNSAPMGYSLAMLDGKQLNGYYHDAYLLAVVTESDMTHAVEGPLPGMRFTGYAETPRWIRLQSGVQVRCVDEGFQLQGPVLDSDREPFERVLRRHGLDDDMRLKIRQRETDGAMIDVEDRIQAAASLLRDLVEADL